KAKVSFQNKVLEINELVITTSGDEVDYLSSGENEVFTIIVEKNLFLEAFFDYFGEPFDLHHSQSRFFIKPHMPQLFVAGITAWISFLKNNYQLLLSADKYGMIESEILKDIFGCLMIEKISKMKSGFKIEKARDFLHASLNESLDSMSLSHELGISQRQMERLFKANYGITPKRYLLNLRLNAARKELLLSHPTNSTISAIALKYNFFDLNHFSKAYKLMFNELPSQTLQQ
ncbi:MAG: helix-turn-helix domain-containing protein, partial [Campylobacterota bacterium]|nr:helix-turn-helix domain-containing protein [Campylobacterota bacterium]